MDAAVPTGTVTFLFTDIEGSTSLWERAPQAMKAALARHDALLRSACAAHRGHVFKTIGDAFCVAFASPSDALQAALDAQQQLAAQAWGETPLKVRMGLHTGETDERDGDYFGPPVNRAARLMAAGHGGQVLLSSATQELVRDRLPAGAELQDLGEHRLKDLFRPAHVFQLKAPGLPATFPPLRSLDRKPTNLRAQATPFIGREDQLATVLALLRDTDVRLVTLAGPGGTGKTRLAMQAAAELLDEYEHGVWLVDLALVTNPALVVAAIANAFGLEESADSPLEAQVLQHAAERQQLLVLDNYEHVIAAAELVARLLSAAPRLKVLVTSREVLRLYGEHTHPVPPLALPNLARRESVAAISQYEAVSLFIQRARAADPKFRINDDNAPAVAEICVRLDGLPLAIELAAARIPLFAPRQLLQRLGDRLKTVGGGQRDLPVRQRTLRGAIDWSYELLAPDEKTLFARLSVFNGGRSLEGAEAVCGEGLAIDVAEGLESLIHKSLLRQVTEDGGEPRFVMLETLHEYARERLVASGEEEAVRQRHLDYFVRLAEPAEAEVLEGLALDSLGLLYPEQDNILAALDWSFQSSPPRPGGLRLATGACAFWWRTARTSLSQQWASRALAHEAGLAASQRARLLVTAGLSAYAEHDMARARELHTRGLELFRETGERRLVARTLMFVALTTIKDPSVYQTGLACLDEAMDIVRTIHDPRLGAMMLNARGELTRGQGDYIAAREAYQSAIALTPQIGDALFKAVLLGNLSYVFAHDGDAARALETAQQALRLSVESQTEALVSEDLSIVARALGLCGQAGLAVRLYGAADRLMTAVGASMQASDMPDYEAGVACAREAVGEAEFKRLWAEGRAIDSARAVELALAATVDG
jgi:predicted ATPase/class 3 adenylate cyclase